MDSGSTSSSPQLKTNPIMPVSSPLAFLLGLRPILKRYETLAPTYTPWDFAQSALQTMGIFVINEGENLENTLPSEGPALVYANHPFGGIEGVIMAARCGLLRPDFKLLANSMLCKIPELSPMIIPINVTAKSQQDNFSSVRTALKHVEKGGALGLFPSGIVAHWHMLKMSIIEPIWYSLCGRIAKIPNICAIPVFFKGTNSPMFHAAGCIHPMFRTLLLPRELWRMRGRTLRYVVGRPVDKKLLQAFGNDKARTAHMRVRCESLAQNNNALPKIWSTPVAKAHDPKALHAEVEQCINNDPLVTEGNFVIFAIEGKESKHILHEICRLREETFRLVGEGSGEARDMDQFDKNYTHLVLWDTQNQCLVGAYRVLCFESEKAKEIIPTLYTATLFDYKDNFFDDCQTSMELGRAFVVPEYQRDYEPLMLLWKGIGRLTYRKKIRTLFGPCSMGLEYANASAYMLREYLKENHWHENLSSLVRGRQKPMDFEGLNVPDVQGLDYKDCNRAVKDIEGDKGLPILFKHYLQLGGRIAAFHEDRVFGTLDGLLVVDLANSPQKTLLRYLTAQELQELQELYAQSQ